MYDQDWPAEPFIETKDYQAFLESKRLVVASSGRDVPQEILHDKLFPFQRDLVQWSLRKGRAALFADTGLGKTFMQLEWAKHAAERVLILAPLAVARQTVNEGAQWGIPVTYARSQEHATPSGITITNYEMLSHFDVSQFGAVVLDESSILKSFEGKIRTALIEAFSNTPLRLCCTATPAPNDIAEIANHAEFLGLMTRVEMLASFFVHDDAGWRLKGHAQSPFYRWLASWGMSIRRPSDLGYSDEGYNLPSLEIASTIVPTDWKPPDKLFATGLSGIRDRANVRQYTLEARVRAAADLVNSNPNQAWLAWVGLNEEGTALARMIKDSVLVEGSQTPDVKADALERFARGDIRVLVTKPTIAGFGMNFQRCSHMVFVGLGDSYEQYYQSIRRCYRYGQKSDVKAHIVLSDPEQAIFDNVLRKEKEAVTLADELLKHVVEFEQSELRTTRQRDEYQTGEASGKDWRLLLGDSAERLKEVADNSVDLSIFSPPFATLFTYSNSERDLGNARNYDEFWQHYQYITNGLMRVIKPGRNIAVHVQQLPLIKSTDGVIGIRDFRGEMISHFVKGGWVYHGEVCIDKDPQAQAIRTHSKGLLFVQLHKDSAWMRPAFADYILIFRKPGENAVPVVPDLSNEEWIEWARPIWYGLKESDTLNVSEARSEEDERHICPLQLGTIERCIRLWTNKGETVLSPFAGIGSEGHEAIRLGRKFVGIELKPEYFKVATKNLKKAETSSGAIDLFAYAGLAV